MAKICNKSITDTGVEFAFTSGEVVSVELDSFSPEIVKQLALHGLSQKAGDSYAGAENAEEAQGLMLKVIERLEKGEWTAKRESTGGGKVTDLARALAEATGRDLSEAVEILDKKDKAEKMALRKHKAIAPILARMAAEKAAKIAAEAEEEEPLEDLL